MKSKDARRRETESLIEAIWGPLPAEQQPPVDPVLRESQNKALAAALRAYLQEYLSEAT